MFYQFLLSAVFAVLAVAVVGFVAILKEDKPEYKAADQFKNLSACCRAEVVQVLRRAGTMEDPPEYEDLCTACGRVADLGLFLVNPDDGTLTDTMTGKAGLEQTPSRDLDFDGPDPDAEMEARRELKMESRMGRSWRIA